MLERIQAFANADGTISPERIEIFDAQVRAHPVTGEPIRGELIRDVKLSADARQRIADAINAELAGATKAAERLTAMRVANEEKKAREEPKGN